jgi:sulfite dehydrogenase (cytochrome) subunit A
MTHQPSFESHISSAPKALDRRLDRRAFLRAWGMASAAASAGAILGAKAAWGAPDAEGQNPLLAGRPLVRYPGKTDLILLTSRPPQLETPMKYFENAITPNEAFYVRYHIPPPKEVDLSKWRLRVTGSVDKPLELSFDDLQSKFPRTSIVAVNQCSGNSRGYFSPRIFGGQWASGAMGNAEWTGVRLRDILSAAVSRIMEDPTVIVAHQMNGQPLPLLNGFPARLVVPGWYATYWVKNLSEITILDREFDGFWMRKAYLIPDNACGCVEPGSTPTHMVPINRMDVRSLIVTPEDGARLSKGQRTTIRGVAFDGGYGIDSVLLSTDGGETWRAAQLGKDLGDYSFRQWSLEWSPPRAGSYRLMAQATNRIGQSQPAKPLWNPAGYLRNVIEEVNVNVG